MQLSVSLKAYPEVYTGFSPAFITFAGQITVSGLAADCTVQYRFIRSDGGHSPVEEIAFHPPGGTKNIKTAWQLGMMQFMGWEAIEVVSPEKLQSNKAAFSVKGSDLLRPFQSLSVKRHVRRDVLLIYQNSHPVDASGKPLPVPTIGDLQNLVNEVRAYFEENSNGLFSINLAGVLGPFELQKPWPHYTRIDPGDSDHDGWENQFSERYAEALRSAAVTFSFGDYDRDGNKVLSTDNLAIVIVTPGTYARGFVREALASDHPWSPLVVNGITFTQVIDFYTNTPPFTNDTRGGLAHELAHVLLQHVDMYYEPPFNMPDCYQPYRPGPFSIMDRDDGFFHLDPLCKLKCGWVTPHVIGVSGSFGIGAVETSHQVHVLVDNARGADEYFLLENRSTAVQSLDKGLPDTGLAIWHIIENAAVYGGLPAPHGVPETDWSRVPQTDWGRRAVRLIRADASRPLKDTRAFWGGSEFKEVELHWADGSLAFNLRAISAPGLMMNYTCLKPQQPVQMFFTSEENQLYALGYPGFLVRVHDTGGAGLNMYALQRDDGQVTGLAGYNYWIGTQRLPSPVTAIVADAETTLVGFSDGRVLKIHGAGGGGQNMFGVMTTEDEFEAVPNYQYLAGSQRFHSGIHGLHHVGGVLYVALENGALVKIKGFGGGGKNMFALQESDGGITGMAGYDYWIGTQRLASPATAIVADAEVTLIGFADGRVLKIRGTGGGGQNMFGVVATEDGFEAVPNYQYLEGSQRFHSGVRGLHRVGEVLYVALEDGTLVKIKSFGGGGKNMFALQAAQGRITGMAGYDYWLGTQQFASPVTAIVADAETTLIGFADGRILKIHGTGGGGQNMFGVVATEDGFEAVPNYQYLEGSQRFHSGVSGLHRVGEVLYVALENGTLMKIKGFGEGGKNMFALQETQGQVTGVAGHDCWIGSQVL